MRIAPEATDSLGAFGTMDVAGCLVVATDWMDRVVRVLRSGPDSVVTLGRAGEGPGEFLHPRAVALGADSVVTAIEWGRRRLLRFSIEGTLLSDVPLKGAVAEHGPVGRFRALGGGLFADFWLADRVAGWMIPTELFDTMPLVSILGSDGVPRSGGWGEPVRPVQDDALTLRFFLQSGDVAVLGDSLFILRGVSSTVEVFSILAPTRKPVRTIRLTSFRNPIEPHETGTRVGERGLTQGTTQLRFGVSALALAVDSQRRLYVATLLPRRDDERRYWPAEALIVYDDLGRVLRRFLWRGGETRDLRIAADGSLLRLGYSDRDPASGRHIEIYRVFAPDNESSMCPWHGTAAESRLEEIASSLTAGNGPLVVRTLAP